MKNPFSLIVAVGGLVLSLQAFPSLAILAEEPDFTEALKWWSFQPAQDVKVPDFHDVWTFNDIDRFIWA